MRNRSAFTLIELLVVVAVVALLVGVMLPALGAARDSARRVACTVNLRSIETAHASYTLDHDGWMLGSTHGQSWIETLRDYDPSLLLRSPVDTSPHFEGGEPVRGRFRLTSYSINYEITPDNPNGVGRIDKVAHPWATAHAVIAAFTGPGAVQDHVHPRLWWSPIPGAIPGKAAGEVQIDAHGGPSGSTDSVSTYGYLDGHADAARFADVYTSPQDNAFLP